jgi:N-acetylglucosamine kinase-like BadF-type ATPase
MKIIAESSSTRTEWSLVDGATVVEHAFTTGINPYFQSRREISHSIRLELPDKFFRHRWEHIYFYGAGCANKEKNVIVSSSLIAQFKARVTVESDLVGAARGLLIREPGLACILDNGSNSCYYDGKEIVKNVAALGYILGDEGSNSYLGKVLIADVLKEIAPSDLREKFYEKFKVTSNMLMEDIYANSLPNRALAHYSEFLAEHRDDSYVYDLVYSAFMRFFRRNIAQYDYKNNPLCFVGSAAVTYQEILQRVASDFGVEIAKIARTSMDGLVKYHAQD